MGGLNAREYVCRSLHGWRHQERTYGENGHRIHDVAGSVVHRNIKEVLDWLLPDWWWHSRRFPHLCRSHAAAGSAVRRDAAMGLLLSDQRLHDQLRLLLRRNAKREDH